ncbi:MAG: S49 family peptidase [Pseudolabrys sp.]|nr:S49 family peptidase [Pseudolabrys sp.]MBV9260675.1 S49 family peptidase [Pseudolabrys sp.]
MTARSTSPFAFFRNFIPQRFRRDITVVPVVRLNGVIGAAVPLRPGLTLQGVARTLERAFSVRGARAVALIVNSPGGSPAQSHLIYRRIRELADEKKLSVLIFIEDVGASGGYMLACAGDEIIADTFSIVGSIGVVGGSFGFPELMKKLGVERRVYTAGERKVTLDPFLPEKPDDVKRIKAIQKDIHEHFIALVKERRGGKLNGADKTLFSGEFWTASSARDLGLIDQIGDLRSVLRARYGEKVRTPVISGERRLFGLRLPGSSMIERFAQEGGLTADAISAVEARAIWARFGL